MAFRFRRTLRLFPGLRLNLGKKSASLSFGIKGLKHTVGTRGTRSTVGLPGSGLSYSTESRTHEEAPSRRRYGRWIVAALLLAGILLVVMRSAAPPAPSQPRPEAVVPVPLPEAARAQPSSVRPPLTSPAPGRAPLSTDPWAKARQTN